MVVLHSVEVVAQGVEASGPGPAVGLQPLVELAQRLWLQLVPPTLGLRPDDDELGLAQGLEVFRDRRLGQPQQVDQLAYRAVPVVQRIEDPAPVWLGEDLEQAED